MISNSYFSGICFSVSIDCHYVLIELFVDLSDNFLAIFSTLLYYMTVVRAFVQVIFTLRLSLGCKLSTIVVKHIQQLMDNSVI